MAITLNGTTGITTPDINTTAQSTDITTTGDISAVDVTASGGVYLGGTAAANYLDDYEEGTFTPTDASGAGLTLGAITSARYVKIGKRVFCDIEINYPSTSDANGVIVGGFPFTSANDGNYATCACMNNANLNLWCFIATNTTNMTLYKQTVFPYTQATNADVSAKTLYISIAYDVA